MLNQIKRFYATAESWFKQESFKLSYKKTTKAALVIGIFSSFYQIHNLIISKYQELSKEIREDQRKFEERLEMNNQKLEERMEISNQKLEERMEMNSRKLEERMEINNRKLEKRLKKEFRSEFNIAFQRMDNLTTEIRYEQKEQARKIYSNF